MQLNKTHQTIRLLWNIVISEKQLVMKWGYAAAALCLQI